MNFEKKEEILLDYDNIISFLDQKNKNELKNIESLETKRK